MSLEKKLLAGAIEATGDDSIVDVAEFQPKGTAGSRAAGAAVGSVAGGATTGGDSWGKAIGVGAGAVAGSAAVGLSRHLPPYICVAASPTTVYLLGMRSAYSHKKLDPIAHIDRSRLGVEIHQRASVRTVVLEDLDTETKFALETPRLNFYHGKAMVELLMLSDEHHDEEPTDAEIEAANA